MHSVLVNNLGDQCESRNSVVRVTDRPDMTVAVYHGRKTTSQTTTTIYTALDVTALSTGA